MDLEKVKRAVSLKDYAFYKDIICKFFEIFGDDIGINEGIALVKLLQVYEIDFWDGTNLNSDTDPIGNSDAAVIVSGLVSNPDESSNWWFGASNYLDIDVSEMQKTIESLVKKIQNHNSVEKISL